MDGGDLLLYFLYFLRQFSMISEALGMSAPAGEGAKSGLSIMEVAGNAVNIPPQKNLAFIFHLNT